MQNISETIIIGENQSMDNLIENYIDNDNDNYDDYDDEGEEFDTVTKTYENIKEEGEKTNSNVQQSMKHFQPTNKILSK